MADDVQPLPLFDDRPMPADDPDDTRRLPPVAEPAVGPRTIEPPPAPTGAGALVRLGWPLLALLARLAGGGAPADPERLKAEAAGLIREFERAALADGIEPRLISASRYTLCTALDEAVTLADPAAANVWARGSLLSLFHNETWGGEKVFILTERALAEPDRYADLLELCHLVLVLGFQGKFRRERDGTAKVDALRARLFEALRPRYGDRPPFPAAARRTAARPGRRIIHYVPVWSVAVVCLLLSALVFTWFDYQLKSGARHVAASIREVSGPAAGGSE
jgi:type VI secretion system protein ImpK